MTQRNPIAPGQGASPRVAELHRLAAEDYAKGQRQRATAALSPSYAAASLAVPTVEPSDLAVAVRVAQQLLDSDQILSLRESLRLLLRALDAEPSTGIGRCPDCGLIFEACTCTGTAPDRYPAVLPERPAPCHGLPVGPGCGAPATTCFEGYSPKDGLAHGRLDLVVHACDKHTAQARTEWLGDLTPYRTAGGSTSCCGASFDFTTLRGGQ